MVIISRSKNDVYFFPENFNLFWRLIKKYSSINYYFITLFYLLVDCYRSDINQSFGDGWTPLHFASDRQDKIGTEIVTFLLQNFAQVNVYNRNFQLPIHVAIDGGNTATIKVLLEYGAAVDAQDSYGLTPLHYAAKRGNSQAIAWLLQLGSLPDVLTYGSLQTPLHYAVNGSFTMITGNSLCVQLLLRGGASPSKKSSFGETPLHYAVRKGDRELCFLLLNGGSDVFIKNIDGDTPVQLAKRNGHMQLANQMIHEGLLRKQYWLLYLVELIAAGRAVLNYKYQRLENYRLLRLEQLQLQQELQQLHIHQQAGSETIASTSTETKTVVNSEVVSSSLLSSAAAVTVSGSPPNNDQGNETDPTVTMNNAISRTSTNITTSPSSPLEESNILYAIDNHGDDKHYISNQENEESSLLLHRNGSFPSDHRSILRRSITAEAVLTGSVKYESNTQTMNLTVPTVLSTTSSSSLSSSVLLSSPSTMKTIDPSSSSSSPTMVNPTNHSSGTTTNFVARLWNKGQQLSRSLSHGEGLSLPSSSSSSSQHSSSSVTPPSSPILKSSRNNSNTRTSSSSPPSINVQKPFIHLVDNDFDIGIHRISTNNNMLPVIVMPPRASPTGSTNTEGTIIPSPSSPSTRSLNATRNSNSDNNSVPNTATPIAVPPLSLTTSSSLIPVTPTTTTLSPGPLLSESSTLTRPQREYTTFQLAEMVAQMVRLPSFVVLRITRYL